MSCCCGSVNENTLFRSTKITILVVCIAGKAYAVVGFSESIVPMVAGVVYAEVYYTTVDVYPGAAYLVSAGAWGLSGLIYW